jgi:hypothetical protein
MALKSLAWKLASPYDAYVSHVLRLDHAIARIRDLSSRALGYEVGLSASVRLIPGSVDPVARAQGFRNRLGQAAESMTDAQFEEFLAHLGGGSAADVETDRATAVSRLSVTTRGLEDFFAIAGHELALLEERGYNPGRSDVARQLRENGIARASLADYRHELHELGTKVGRADGAKAH